MPMEKVTVVATFKAKEGKTADLKAAIGAVVAPTRAEPGCINYDLHQDAEDPAVFMLYENWVSKKDLDEHLAMPYLQELIGKTDELLMEPIGLTRYHMISEPA